MPNVKATKLIQKRCDAAVESFHKYYVTLWGDERWHSSLFPALCRPTRYCAVVNRFGHIAEVKRVVTTDDSTQLTGFEVPPPPAEVSANIDRGILVAQKMDGETFPAPLQVTTLEGKHVLSNWNMDFASVLAACVLQVQPGERVLDLCAAPGGKSIVLSQTLWPGLHADVSPTELRERADAQSFLHSNEFDQPRYKRLVSNLQSYLPSSLFADGSVKVLQVDASQRGAVGELPFGQHGYDKILLDAPCSSERHIIHAYLKALSGGQVAEEMMNWKASHSKTLAKTQLALLMTALKAVKMGGAILYATCSISTEENDGVIERALEAAKRERKKNPDSSNSSWQIVFNNALENIPSARELLDSLTEKTKYGRIALPDHAVGSTWGPLYFCLLHKVPLQA